MEQTQRGADPEPPKPVPLFPILKNALKRALILFKHTTYSQVAYPVTKRQNQRLRPRNVDS